jgi:hypothetical protein
LHSACIAAIHHCPGLLGYNCCVAEFARHTELSIGVALTDLVSTHQHHVDFEGGVRTRIVLDTSVLVADPSQRKTPIIKAVTAPLAHYETHLRVKYEAALRDYGFQVEDEGAFSTDPVDYPDVAVKVAEVVRGGRADRGEGRYSLCPR